MHRYLCNIKLILLLSGIQVCKLIVCGHDRLLYAQGGGILGNNEKQAENPALFTQYILVNNLESFVIILFNMVKIIVVVNTSCKY